MFRRELWQLTLLHFKELLREPGVIFWGVGFPVLMAWGLGIAFNSEPESKSDIGLLNPKVNEDLMYFMNQYATGGITFDSLDSYIVHVNDEVFGKNTFRFVPVSEEYATTAYKRGRFQLILEAKSDSLIYRMDPANPDARLLQLQLTQLFESSKETNNLKISEAKVVPFELQGTRYVDYLVPGLVALGIMMACMWGISYTIIERRKGLMLRRMIATPMRKSNLLSAQMTSRVTLNFLEALLLILFAYLYFDIVIQGSLIALFIVFIAGNMAFTGLAVLLSSRTSKTEIGNALINLFTMPMLILSGIFFSYKNFPDWAIGFIEVLPLTLLADSIRGIFNEGIGILDILPETMILVSIGVICFGIGLKLFKWY